MTNIKQELKLKKYRIPYGEELIFKPRYKKISILDFLSLDGSEENQNLYKDLFSNSSNLSKHGLSLGLSCIAYKDLIINEDYKKCTTFAIYGDATIDTVVNCDILFVNGNLTINKRLYAKLLIVTGNVISEHADLIVTNFHIAKNLEANCILFAGEHYANFCIVGGYCNVNQIDEHTSLSKTDPYNDALIVKGDFLCRHLNLSRKLLVSNTPNSICKIEKVIENKKFSLEANNVEITQEAKFHNIVKCYNLITQSRIFSSSSFLCDGNFTAHENVELTRLIVKGDLTILGNNIVTAHEVTVYGNIKGEIHTLKLKTYVHVFK